MTNEVKAAVERAADRIQTASEGPTGTGIFASEAIEIILSELAALPEPKPWRTHHAQTAPIIDVIAGLVADAKVIDELHAAADERSEELTKENQKLRDELRKQVGGEYAHK